MDLIDDTTLGQIGSMVTSTYEDDEASRFNWLERYERAQKLAAQVFTKKNYPWPGASNVKHPLMTIAAMQFHARAYPALIPSGDVVTGRVIGRDPDGAKRLRAERIGMHMSYQLLYKMPSWEEDKDKMLITLPITGSEFTKTFYNPESGINEVRPVLASNLVVHYYTKDLASAARVTEILQMSRNEIIEKQRAGLWADVDLYEIGKQPRDDIVTQTRAATQGLDRPSQDEDVPFKVLEQHNYLDLDNDGYKEPYIVTVEASSKRVLRIVARFGDDSIKRNDFNEIAKIIPDEYFTKYSFIPSPDGGFYDMGFGSLLGPLNEVVNTVINQLVDAGTLSTMQAGFISKGLRLRAGDMNFKPGEWKQVNAYGVDLKQSIMPLPVKEPSLVLFQLLGYMVDAGEKLTSTADMMAGENPGQNQKATTTMAVLDQGMKVYTAIYKRIRRDMGKEFTKLYKLNAVFLDENEEFNVIQPNSKDLELISMDRDDYDEEGINVFPSADPNMTSQMQRLSRAQALLEMLPLGGFNEHEVKKRVLEGMEVEDIDVLLPEPKPEDQKPSIDMLKLELEAQKETNEENERSWRRKFDALRFEHEMEEDEVSAELDEEAEETKKLAAQGKIMNDQQGNIIKNNTANKPSGSEEE